jgi:hypothetical protein
MPTILDLFSTRINDPLVYNNVAVGTTLPDNNSTVDGDSTGLKKSYKSKSWDGLNLWNIGSKIRIETRGIIDIPRGAALLTSSPDTLADLIGNQIGGALGGNANRPSDTVFRKKTVFAKPVTLLKFTHAQLRYTMDDFAEGNTAVYIKDHPAPASLIAKMKQTGASPLSVLASAAVDTLQNYGSARGLTNLRNAILGARKEGEGYGVEFSRTDMGKKPLKETAKFSTHYPIYQDIELKPPTAKTKRLKAHQQKTEARRVWERTSIAPREHTALLNGKSKFDYINENILAGGKDPKNLHGYEKDSDIKEVIKEIGYSDTPYVHFAIYGKTDQNILLPGTISGYTEDFAPDISTFKYIGSPFNLYRYSGVERTLRFNLKTYYLDGAGKANMRRNLNKLRRLVFPDEHISSVKIDKNYSQLAFSPTIFYLTIPNMFYKTLAIIESLSFSVEDNVPWATTYNSNGDKIEMDGDNDPSTKPYPVAFDITFSMKIIENPGIKKEKDQSFYAYDGLDSDGKSKYTNYFTGYTPDGITSDDIDKAQKALNSFPLSAIGL